MPQRPVPVQHEIQGRPLAWARHPGPCAPPASFGAAAGRRFPGCRRPWISSKSVVLPTPLPPTTPTLCPACTVKDRPSKMARSARLKVTSKACSMALRKAGRATRQAERRCCRGPWAGLGVAAPWQPETNLALSGTSSWASREGAASGQGPWMLGAGRQSVFDPIDERPHAVISLRAARTSNRSRTPRPAPIASPYKGLSRKVTATGRSSSLEMHQASLRRRVGLHAVGDDADGTRRGAEHGLRHECGDEPFTGPNVDGGRQHRHQDQISRCGQFSGFPSVPLSCPSMMMRSRAGLPQLANSTGGASAGRCPAQ